MGMKPNPQVFQGLQAQLFSIKILECKETTRTGQHSKAADAQSNMAVLFSTKRFQKCLFQ